MRLQILVDVGTGITLPINYNHWLAGSIYHSLAKSSREYADFLHDDGYRDGEKRFKLFTFSQLMARHRRVVGERIHFDSTLSWYVSSPVERFLLHFADTLLTEGRLNLGSHRLNLKDVSIPRIPRMRASMYFRCLSPVVMSQARQRDGRRSAHYCLPDDSALSELIRRNLIRKHKVIYGSAPANDILTFRYDPGYIRKKQERVTRLVDYKGIKIRGVLCPFIVEGSPSLIRVGYECGFGEKNSAGFGMAGI